MMPTLLTRTADIVLNSRTHAAADDSTQPIIIPDTLPPLIKKRFAQAQRIDTRADWKEFSRLCSITAIGFFQSGNYDPNNADFRSVCQLARIGYLRGAGAAVAYEGGAMNQTQQMMADIFNEWARRYAENPDEFGEILDADGRPVEDYGQRCVLYFESIATDMDAKAQIDGTVTVHVTPSIDETCNHDWEDGSDGPDSCRKCGLSFTRYIHSCCP